MSQASFKHISLWRLETLDEESSQNLKQKLQATVAKLREQIPGIKALELGIDVGGPGDRSDVALYSEFETREDVQNYINHPAHLELVKQLKRCRVETRVVDYFTPNQRSTGDKNELIF